MANLGSAMNRALSLLDAGEKDLFEKAKEECSKIIEEIIANNDSTGAVLEASILRDLLRNQGIKRSELNAYFSSFSLRLMQKQ